MERQALHAALVARLRMIAPEINPIQLDSAAALRDQVDLDSMDWLNFLTGLHTQFGIDIPEADYARLRTLDDLIDYLAARIP